MIITNLLTNMVVLLTANVVPTNTPAFQEYAVRTMLTNAQFVAARWSLDMRLMASNEITHVTAVPTPVGLRGEICFGERYAFSYNYGRSRAFADLAFENQRFLTGNVHTNAQVLEEWIGMTNWLTLRKARQIAQNALPSLGVSFAQMKFRSPIKAGQWTYERDGKTYQAPYYQFRWDSNVGYCAVDVSGITSNLVYFYHASPHLKLETPGNYFELLGLPTNTVFVKRKFTLAGTPAEYEIFDP